MSKLFLLLKTYGLIYLGSIAKKSNKKEIYGGGLIIFFVGLLFVGLFSSTAITTISQFMSLEKPMPLYALYVLTATGLIFMLLTVVLKGTSTKKSNDQELLLSLPISKFIIVLSKVLKDFFFDFIALILIMLPGYVCYYLYVPNTSFMVVVYGLITVLLLTLISNALSIFLNTLIFKFTRRLKYAEVIQTFISVVITISFIIIYYFVNMSMTTSTTFVTNFLDFYPLQLIVNFIAFGDIKSFFILLLICLIPFMIAVAIYVSDFNKENSSKHSLNKELVFKQNSVSKDLFKKEVSNYFRSNLYVLNTIIGGLFILLFAFLILGFGVDRITNMVAMLAPDALDYFKYPSVIIILMLTLIASTAITTSPSISLEGKRFWILKAHPIKEKDIFNAKLGLNMLIGGIPSLIGGILLTFVLGIKYLPFAILMPILSVFYGAISGLMNNLKYYKLDWKDEQEVIKQGMSVLITLATALVPGVVLLITYFLTCQLIHPYLFLVIALVLFVLVDLYMYKRLLTNGAKRFRNIIE